MPKILLTPPEIERIHDASLRILETVGVIVEHAEMRERLCSAGCVLHQGRIRMPPAVIEAALAQVPSDGVTLYGRDPTIRVTLNGTRTYGGSAGVPPNIYDFESGEIRPSTRQDLIQCVTILDALSNVSVIGSPTVEPGDLSPKMTILGGFTTIFSNTVKPFRGPGPRTAAEARYMIQLGSAVRGGLEQLRQKPFFASYFTPLSPLKYPRTLLDGLAVVADAGLPLCIHPDIVVGITSPITLAGTLAQLNAELLAGMVMAYQIHPGLPFIRIGVMDIGDMRQAIAVRGNPELGMLRIGQTQLAHYYGIPQAVNVVYGTSSKTLDYQAGYEKALNGMVGALAGPDILGGMPGLGEMLVTSLEALVLDNEILGMILRVLRGFDVDEDTLGVDLQGQVATGDTFMALEHTVRHLRAGEIWQPSVSQRQSLSEWLEEGQPAVTVKARDVVRSILAEHRAPALPMAVAGEVEAILSEAERALPDNPYDG